MRALVTGGNGFIGSHVVRRLQSAGHEVRVLAQNSTPLDPIEGTGAEVVRGDLMVPESIAEAVRGIDTVFHLAALVRDWGPARDFMRVNHDGTRTLIEAAGDAGVQRLVLVSSVAVHRIGPGGIPDGHEDLPRDNVSMPYALSKIRAEDEVLAANASGRMEGVVVRPGLFPFGPHDLTTFKPLADNLRKYLHVSGGRATICYSYAGNLAHGIALAGEVPGCGGRTYTVTDGARITWKELMDRVCDALGAKRVRASVPFGAAYAAATLVEQASKLTKRPPILTRYRVLVAGRDCYFGCERARRELGYIPNTDIDEGLRLTVEWLRERKANR